MALSYSTDKVDESGRELLTYGTSDFPIAFFDDDLCKVKVPWHWHDELELVVILEGTVRVRLANREITLSSGEGYFANTGILHAAELLSACGHQHAAVFSPAIISPAKELVWNTYIEPLLDNPKVPFIHLHQSISWQKEILDFAETAWIYGAHDKKNYPLVVREALSNIFSRILDNIDFIDDLHFSDKEHRDELRIKKTLLFIENNYAEKITIDDIAKSADMSVSTCLRLYRTALGTTPVNYLVKYRLKKAAEMLSENDKPISEISYDCGFNEPGYFNKCFRKEYGVTPTDYISFARK